MLREPSVVCANVLRKSKLFLPEFSFLHKKLASHQADIQILDLFVIIEPTIPGLFCPPGSKVVGDGCQVCPVGTYNDAENTTSCNQCPTGTTTENNGTVNVWECGRYFLSRCGRC